MNYDDWKTHNPDDDRCEFCGAAPWESRGGWQPSGCNGECRTVWRDPDHEYEKMRDEPNDRYYGANATRAGK